MVVRLLSRAISRILAELHVLSKVIICMNGWRLKRQTNGNAIIVAGQKTMLDNSIDKDQIA